MRMQVLPKWAWISLFFTVLTTIIVATIGIGLVLDDRDETLPTLYAEIQTDSPISVEVARLPSFTPSVTLTFTPSPSPSVTPSFTPTTQVSPSPQISATEAISPTATVALAETEANTTASSSGGDECPKPEGWVAYNIMEGDTLFAFQLGANRAGNPATVDEILAANCLGSSFLQIGQLIWLPSGAADHAPSSEPAAPPAPPVDVPREGNCPCTITINAGWRVEQIADQINRLPVAFSGADFLAVVGRGAAIPPRDFLASVPAGSGLEGFMMPGSYTVYNDTNATAFRDMVLDAFAANAGGLIQQASGQGISPYQAVILASIVQREAGGSEQPFVASVFHNRLRGGKSIGATVTVQYALGVAGNWWPRLQAGQVNLDSPYNTLIYGGFTPTPISSPGMGALQAVISPAQTNYFYFTGNCHGSGNLYAETYEQHLANVQSCS